MVDEYGRSGWRLRMLGAFRLEHDSRTVIEFTTRRQDVVLAYLALHQGEDLSRPAVAGIVWGDRSRTLALNRLTEVLTLLNRQRRAAGVPISLIEGGGRTFHLHPAVRTDIEDFEDLMARALVEKDPAQKVALLENVVDVHGSGLLPALHEPWVIAERLRLARVRDHAARLLVELSGASAVGMAAVEVGRYLARGRRLQEASASAHAGELPAPSPPAEPADEPEGQEPENYLDGVGRHLAEASLLLVERAEPNLHGAERAVWLERLDGERDKIYEAIEWSLDRQRSQMALRLTAAMWRYWYHRLRTDEGRVYLGRALASAQRPTSKWYARAANAAGALALHDGDLVEARRRLDEALGIWRQLQDLAGVAQVLNDLGIVAYKEGRFAEAIDRYEEALALIRGLDQPPLLAATLRNVALATLGAGRIDDTRRFAQERLALGRRMQDRYVIAGGLLGLAIVESREEDWQAVEPLVDEAASLYGQEGDLKGVALCLRHKGFVAQETGRLEEARAFYSSSLGIAQATRDVRGAGESLRYLASVAGEQGDLEAAEDYTRQALLLLDSVGEPLGSSKARIDLEFLREKLGAPAEHEVLHPAGEPSR